jgi:hypothetical protein
LNWASRHEGILGEWKYSSTHNLTSALDGGEWSASRPYRFTPRERGPGTHWIGGWVGPRAVLDAVKGNIPNSRRESNPRTPIVQPVAQRYTDWGISAFFTCCYNLMTEVSAKFCRLWESEQHKIFPFISLNICSIEETISEWYLYFAICSNCIYNELFLNVCVCVDRVLFERTHPASYPVGKRGYFPGSKVTGMWSWPLTSI